MEGYITRYLANLKLGTLHIYTGWSKNRTFAIFRAIFCQKNFFFQNDPVGGFLCEESFARIEKSSKRFLSHEIVKNLKKMKNSDFFNDFMVKEAFWRFFNARKRFLA